MVVDLSYCKWLFPHTVGRPLQLDAVEMNNNNCDIGLFFGIQFGSSWNIYVIRYHDLAKRSNDKTDGQVTFRIHHNNHIASYFTAALYVVANSKQTTEHCLCLCWMSRTNVLSCAWTDVSMAFRHYIMRHVKWHLISRYFSSSKMPSPERTKQKRQISLELLSAKYMQRSRGSCFTLICHVSCRLLCQTISKYFLQTTTRSEHFHDSHRCSNGAKHSMIGRVQLFLSRFTI